MTTVKDEQLDKFIAELWVATTRLVKKTRHMSGRLADEYDLTQPQMFALWQLQENGPMTMGELSELLSVTHGVATRMVDRLLKKRLVERHRDESDRRVVRISLTTPGTEATAEAVTDAMAVLRGVFEDVPQRDREEYLVLVNRIEEAQAGASGE
jgi:DNA-binding MarR family transcriptional regulator